MKWSADAFAIEHYHREFDGSFLTGVNTIRLNNVDNILLGTILYLGPSTFGGFVGNEEEITVIGINTITKDVTFSKSGGGGLDNSYISTDPIDFHKTIFLFNDNTFGVAEDNQ